MSFQEVEQTLLDAVSNSRLLLLVYLLLLLLLWLSAEKNAKANHEFPYRTEGKKNIVKAYHTNQLKLGLKYKLLLKSFQNPSLLKDWVKSAVVFENIGWLYFCMSLPESLVMREPVVPFFVAVSVLSNPLYCLDFSEFHLCFKLKLPLRGKEFRNKCCAGSKPWDLLEPRFNFRTGDQWLANALEVGWGYRVFLRTFCPLRDS